MKWMTRLCLFAAIVAALSSGLALAAGRAEGKAADSSLAKGGTVNVNTASAKELEALPGVGAATAKKIVASRPYASVQDLSRAGVSQRTIDQITPMVTVGSTTSASGAPPMIPARPARKATPATPSASTSTSTPMVPAPPSRKAGTPAASAGAPTLSSLVDLNTASEGDLEKLPGVGPAYAKKVIAARPYANVADLSRAGLPKRTLDKVAPLVTVTGAGGASTPLGAVDKPVAAAPPPRPAATPRVPAPANAGGTPAASATPPSPGMVWVNTETKIYHLEGDHWYGKTKHGQWMSENDAIKAGYRKAKK